MCFALRFLTSLEVETVFPSSLLVTVVLFLKLAITVFLLETLIRVNTLAMLLLKAFYVKKFLLTLILDNLETAVPLTLENLIVCNSSLNFLSSPFNSSRDLFFNCVVEIPFILNISIKIINFLY